MAALPKTILVVDDTPTNITLLVEALKPDYRTRVATSGEKALALAKGISPPDLILLDIMMPGMDGYALCALLKADETTRDIPIIFVTAMNEVEDEEKGLALGGLDYIVKPISPSIVRARVRTHLTLSEQKKRLQNLVARLEYQAEELADWNQTLEQRVNEGIARAENLRQIAFHDALTGLANRALLLDRLEHAVSLAGRESKSLGLMFLDLDRFKAVNDTFGHDVGDALLKEVARRLGQCRRSTDTVARMGGDEFVLLLEHAPDKRVYAALAEKIIASLSTPMSIAGCPVQIGASVGIACFPEDGDDPALLMKSADAAMYAAKSAGRGAFRFFQPSMTEAAAQKQKQESELRAALGNGQLELFYQPLVMLDSGAPVALEALLRWRHPLLGLMPPQDFIPLAEESGLIADLDRWVLEEACRQIAAWHGRDLIRVPVAVNLSSRQWAGLAERLLTLRRRYGVGVEELEIELSERAVMADPETTRILLASLRETGVSVTLDNFGTGFSSLAHLGSWPLSALKIHRSFILGSGLAQRDSGVDPQTVRGILALGQGLGLKVLAEGVETAGQAQLLGTLGCMAGQGYYFARPMPADEAGAWLRSLSTGLDAKPFEASPLDL